MTTIEKKSNAELIESTADVLSLEEGTDGDGILPGDSHVRGSGMFMTVMNLVNTVIGSGILALPSSAAKVGWVLAIILMVVSAAITWVGLNYLTNVARKMGGDKTSFGAASTATYKWLVIIVDLCVFVLCFGISIAYLGIASGSLSLSVAQFAPELPKGHVLEATWLWMLVAWVIAAALASLKSVEFLAYTSAGAVACVLYTTVIVVLYSVGVFDPCQGKDAATCVGEVNAFTPDVSGILTSIPVFFTAFACAPSLFNIYNDMINPTERRLNLATITSLTICTALYLVVALCGYFTYGSNVAGNILSSYPVEIWATIARIGTAFVVTVSYPLLMHPARDACIHILHFITGGKINKDSNIVFYTVATILNVGALGGAYFEVPLDLILSIAGSLGTVNLSLTIPFLFYFKMFAEENDFRRKAAPVGIVFGLAMSIVCAYYSIAPLFA